MGVPANKKLSDLKQELLSGGCFVENASFYAKGVARPIDESTEVRNLPDMRLLISPESRLKPWQLCMAHRTAQQLVTARAMSSSGAMSFEDMAAKNPFYKTRMCNQWTKTPNNYCIRGPRCLYAHGPTELRAPLPGVAPRPFLMQMAQMA